VIGEGPAGMVYYHPGRLMDGIIDPRWPEALIYKPAKPGRNCRPTLVGVELAMPYSLWEREKPPCFLGVRFQPEDEFGVFGIHVWVWRRNPKGLLAESNPRVSCGAA
jgi:hypothetical protein